MALCPPYRQCGCAITSETLSVTGAGTAVNPWEIELVSAGDQLPYYTFDNTTARDAELPSPPEGQMAWIEDLNRVQIYDGSGWIPLLMAAPVAYTPSFTGSTTNPNLGTTGTTSGLYARTGPLVVAQFVFIFGGTGISNGDGTYSISLPVAPSSQSGSSVASAGLIEVRDSSSGNQRAFDALIGSAIQLRALNAASYASSAPIAASGIGLTFAAGDTVAGRVTYLTG